MPLLETGLKEAIAAGESLDLLVTRRWNPDEPSGKAWTIFNSTEMLVAGKSWKYLITLGCSVDTRASDGCTPLVTVIKMENNNIQAFARRSSKF